MRRASIWDYLVLANVGVACLAAATVGALGVVLAPPRPKPFFRCRTACDHPDCICAYLWREEKADA